MSPSMHNEHVFFRALSNIQLYATCVLLTHWSVRNTSFTRGKNNQQATVPAPFFSLQKLYVDGVACGWSLVSLSLWADFSKKVHEALLLVRLLVEIVPFGAHIKLLIWDLRWIYRDQAWKRSLVFGDQPCIGRGTDSQRWTLKNGVEF